MTEHDVDLGFGEIRLPAGTHICQIYSHEDERNDALLRFLLQGVKAGECGACFSRDFPSDMMESYFSSHGVSLDESVQSGCLSLADAKDIYFRDNCFDPELMLASLRDFYLRSVKENFTGARVIGEMIPEILNKPGGDRLMEYESRVSLLLRDHPITTVCQYDAHVFDGATIMDILKVHPMMVVRGTVVHNPFFQTPEQFLNL